MTINALSSILGLPFICATSGLFLFSAYNYFRRLNKIILGKKSIMYSMLLMHIGLISFSLLTSAVLIHLAFHYDTNAFPGVCLGFFFSAVTASDSSRTFPKPTN